LNNSQVLSERESSFVDVSANRFKGMSKIMGDFRKAARNSANVRKPLPAPSRLETPDILMNNGIAFGTIPSLENLIEPFMKQETKSILGLDPKIIEFVIQSAIDIRDANLNICKGETEALKRLDFFIKNKHAAVADRSKADVSNNDSSRLSVHFALGTLSPRTVYWKANEAYDECKWLMSHLEMRDFFLYTALAADHHLFQRRGIPLGKKQKEMKWSNPAHCQETWRRWATGETKFPLVDASLRELMSTGYCSNRVRQNAASFLAKDLHIDWRIGAEWFQFLLEDHCLGANWGNWLYFSGVGPDPKNRHFRTVSQSLRYDRNGEYVKKWLPTLREVHDVEAVLRPWDYNLKGFEDPLVDPSTQLTWTDAECLQKTKMLISACNNEI